jgi:multiple sugar transport system substrate-binding protein
MPLTLVLLLAACAPGDPGTDDEPDDTDVADDPDDDDDGVEEEADEPEEATGATSLRVTVWTGNEAHLELFDSIADDFIAQHDTVEEIDFDVLSFDDYNDALTVQLAGGNPPDLGWIFERNAPEFVDAGVLHDVGPELRDDPDYGFDDISEPALSLWVDGDGVFGYPFSTSPFAVFYNAEMFEEAGIDDPDALAEAGDWTWDAVGDAAETIVDQGVANHGLIVRDFDYNIWDNLATVWRGWGATPWSDDGSQCTMADPEMVEALSWFHELAFDRQGHPGPGQSADFFAGDSAMTITQISRASLLEEDGFEWGLVPLPAGPAGDAQVVGQAGIGVFGASQARPEAIEFLKFWTNEENSRAMSQFFPPPRESLLTAEILADTNPLLDEDQLESVVINGIATGDPIPSHVNFAQLRDTIRSELDALWEADADVATVLDQVCAAAEPLLE